MPELPILKPKPIHPLDLPQAVAEEQYFPELDYGARGFKPFGKPPESHFCERCILYYQKLAEKRIIKPGLEGEWPIICRGDRAKFKDYIDPNQYPDPEERRLALLNLDPVAWAKHYLNWEARWYQKEMVQCSSQYKVARCGRRSGKTEAMIIDIWHAAFTQIDKPDTDKYEVLIVAPFEAQVKKIFEELERFKNRSDMLAEAVDRSRKDPYEIQLYNGSMIRGFPVGGKGKGGARSAKVRGQGANRLYYDELDYMADEDIEALLAIQVDNPDAKIWGSSTPTGARTKYHRICMDKSLGYKEFHFISAESPAWRPHVERQFRAIFSEGGYNREFHGEFGQPVEGVFRHKDINNCLREYEYDTTNPALTRRDDCKYIVGVDWNKATGTHIVVLEGGTAGGRTFYRVVDKKVIPKGEFTQIEGVGAVLLMDRKWKADYIYADMGYGDMQAEAIKLQDKLHPGNDYGKRFVAVHGNQTIEIPDPAGGPDPIKKPAKPVMVELTAYWVQMGVLIMPEIEDTHSPILEEEIPYLKIGLVQQMRDFKVEKYSTDGRPRYSQGYEHTLMALCFAALGMMEKFGELRHKVSQQPIRHQSHTFGEQVQKSAGLAQGLPEWADVQKVTAGELMRPSRNTLPAPRSTGVPGVYYNPSANRGPFNPGAAGLPSGSGRPSPARPTPTRRIP